MLVLSNFNTDSFFIEISFSSTSGFLITISSPSPGNATSPDSPVPSTVTVAVNFTFPSKPVPLFKNSSSKWISINPSVVIVYVPTASSDPVI